MMVVSELIARDWLGHRELRENILQYVPENAVLLCNDEIHLHHFYLSDYRNKQNVTLDLKTTLTLHTKNRCILIGVTVWCAVADVGIVGPISLKRVLL